MDLYRSQTSFDPQRGHDWTLNEFFVFEALPAPEGAFYLLMRHSSQKCAILTGD